MRFSRLTAFSIGVLFTAVSVSAVTYVNARSDTPIKACANKKTGAMRYLAKGRCNKSENSLTWSQIGPQGLQGPTGPQGATGAQGIPGAAGQTGATGKSLQLTDATGKKLGFVIGDSAGGAGISPRLLTLIDNRLWYVNIHVYYIGGSASGSGNTYFSDANCIDPIGAIETGGTPSPQLTFGGHSTDYPTPISFSPSDFYVEGLDMSKPIYIGSEISCSLLSESQRQQSLYHSRFYQLQEITPPTYTPPLVLVEQ